jgi:hypothetical protein
MVIRHTLTVLSVGCVGPMCIVGMVARASGSHSHEGREVGLVGDVLGHGVWCSSWLDWLHQTSSGLRIDLGRCRHGASRSAYRLLWSDIV